MLEHLFFWRKTKAPPHEQAQTPTASDSAPIVYSLDQAVQAVRGLIDSAKGTKDGHAYGVFDLGEGVILSARVDIVAERPAP